MGESMAKDFDFSDEVRGLKVPTLFACADADMFPPSHAVEVFELLDGGQRDGGWMGEGRPAGGHALAIMPGVTHYNVYRRRSWRRPSWRSSTRRRRSPRDCTRPDDGRAARWSARDLSERDVDRALRPVILLDDDRDVLARLERREHHRQLVRVRHRLAVD